jgi:hypothetical protein
VTGHPDHLMPLSSVGRASLSESEGPRFETASGYQPVQWRNGNAVVCKTIMSRINTGLHLHAFVAQRTERPVSTRRAGRSNRPEGANLLA